VTFGHLIPPLHNEHVQLFGHGRDAYSYAAAGRVNPGTRLVRHETFRAELSSRAAKDAEVARDATAMEAAGLASRRLGS